MLMKVKELDIYLEAKNVDTFSNYLKSYDINDSIYVSVITKKINGIDYRRTSIFVEEKNLEALYKYLETQYDGHAIIIS